MRCLWCGSFRPGHHRRDDCPHKTPVQSMDERFACPEPHCATSLSRADFVEFVGKSPEEYWIGLRRPATALLPVPGPDDDFHDTEAEPGRWDDMRGPR